MKNFSFTAIIIAIVAPIVKLFPAWALKYTKRTNRFAQKFQLSAIAEESYLLKHPQSEVWVGERIWHLQTRKYMFGLRDTRPELFEAFINNINNGTIFDAAYEIAPEDAVKAKGYTLDSARVIKACDDNEKYLYILAEKQPQSFTAEVIRRLGKNRQKAYFSYLFSKSRWKELAELDVVLFEQFEKNETAQNCLSFMLRQKDYKPNLSAEQLSSLSLRDVFKYWCKNANPFVVAEKMINYWAEEQNLIAINDLLRRLIKTEACPERDKLARKLLQIQSPEANVHYADSLHSLLECGIACPLGFKFLLDCEDVTKVDLNLSLCIVHKVENKILKQDFERFNDKQKERLLIASAEDGLLSKEMLNQAPNETIKKVLLDILEDNAQAKWFEPQLGYSPKAESIKILENYFKTGKIYGTLQDLTFRDYRWVQIFIERNWYDEPHKLKLVQSVFVPQIQFFMQNYGITQAQFEALLTSRNAPLAPEAKLYLKNQTSAPEAKY